MSHSTRLAITLFISSLMSLLCLGQANAEKNKQEQNSRLSLGYFQVQQNSQNHYGFYQLAIKHKWPNFKLALNLPYIEHNFNGNTQTGLGNASLKFSYLTQLRVASQPLYMDFHIKQKLASAHRTITTPVKDSALSVEVSRPVLQGVAFLELGHWWRDGQSDDRQDTHFSSLGYFKKVKEKQYLGMVLDYKPTALGETDSTLSVLWNIKTDPQHNVSVMLGTGLNSNSPRWISGVQLSHRF